MRSSLALFALIWGCAPTSNLSIDLRTDLSPGEEFDRITLQSGAAVFTDPARATDYLRRAVRIGPLRVADGEISFVVEARLVDDVVIAREVRVRAEGDTVIPVWLLRSCAGVMCPRSGDAPGATTCDDGRCVAPECTGLESGEACRGPPCADETSCNMPLADCARALCLSGRCSIEPVVDACAASEYCVPEVGCTPRRDVMRPDAPIRDAGRDTPSLPDVPEDAPGGCWPRGDGTCAPPAIAVAAGALHTCFLLLDGSVACAGQSDRDTLGIPRMGRLNYTVLVPGLPTATAITSGFDHVCAIVTGGALWCWGQDSNGQLGDGRTSARSVPAVVSSLASPVIAASGGGVHTCAVLMNGTSACWGGNAWGQLGDGSFTRRLSPVDVAGGLSFVDVSAGWAQTCFRTTEGSAYCTGANFQGSGGDGTAERHSEATPFVGLPGPVRIVETGGFSDIAHTCVALMDGRVMCVGFGGAGRLGEGTERSSRTPVEAVGLSDVVDLALSARASCALTGSGEVWCWGESATGETGTGVRSNVLVPTRLELPMPARAIEMGAYHGCAILEGGQPYCWGADERFGSGTTGDELAPVPVLAPPAP